MRRMTMVFAIMLTFLCGVGQAFGQTVETLDEPEQLAMSDTLQYALENNPTSHVSNWVNPDTGRSGSVVPVETYTNELGQPCREFITTIVIGGREEQGYGTACRQPDGTWQIVTDEQATTSTPSAPTNVYVYAPPERYYYIYPDAYYYYPSSFYYPYHIYLSFRYVYRGGSFFYGSFYLDDYHFRRHHPIHVRSRIYVGPRIFSRHRWYYRPPVRYRTPVYPPAHRDRYERRRPDRRDSARPVYRGRQENRQRYDLRNRQLQRPSRQPDVKRERNRTPTLRQGRDSNIRDGNRQLQRPRRQPDVKREQNRTSSVPQGRDSRYQNRQLQMQRQSPAIRHRQLRTLEKRPPAVRQRTGVQQQRAKSPGLRERGNSRQDYRRQDGFQHNGARRNR